MEGSPQGQYQNPNNNNTDAYGVQSDDGIDIDLENAEDIKKVEQEFLALYN